MRALAFMLPQFYPTPYNDVFWGRGFTEWTNVTRARPLFDGHQQPHLPADLGFYDLRVPETRIAQAALARRFGLHGFVYYHYWFHGRRLLERPLDDLLSSGTPDFPFCLCWANEHWTRRWDGLDAEVLVSQQYSRADDRTHIRWLARVFSDPRYIRIDDRPLFLVYRASHLPDVVSTTALWREEARRLGLGELYLCRVESFPAEKGDPRPLGFDAAVEFQPDWEHLGPSRVVAGHRVVDYREMVTRMLARQAVPYPRFPTVTPSWDNSARRRDGAVVLDAASPPEYEQWLSRVVSRFLPFSAEENFVFINAWNEWAEGNHLEPCQRWGQGYLEATARALRSGAADAPPCPIETKLPAPLPSVQPPIPSKAAPDPARTGWLTELYNLASAAAVAGDQQRAAVLFDVVAELATASTPNLAGKACYKLAQCAESDAKAVELLDRCLLLCPDHVDARRQRALLGQRVRY